MCTRAMSSGLIVVYHKAASLSTKNHADRAARAEGAVNGQIGHIQNAVGNVHADGHDAPDEALCHSAGHGVYQRGQEIHKNIIIS